MVSKVISRRRRSYVVEDNGATDSEELDEESDKDSERLLAVHVTLRDTVRMI